MEPDDLRLIRALQMAPRASFARLAAVLGMHERTVSRRYSALRRQGMIRIFGLVNPMALGQQAWNVRVRCRPDASTSIATALAKRPDVAWVGISGAGSEVSFAVRSLSAESRELLLTRSLPRTAQVLDIEARVILHVFIGMESMDWAGLETVLSSEEAAQLADSAVPPIQNEQAAENRTVTLEPYDTAIVDCLVVDGRAGTARLAEAAGISEGRAARRLATLIRSRTVMIDLDLAATLFGYPMYARIDMMVSPSQLDRVGREIADIPEVGYAAAISGRTNLMASLTCRDLDHLYQVASDRIGSIAGIVSMQIEPATRIVKQSGGLVVDGRLIEP
ncbi:transcriptional regulator [Microlunatus endophyticus]|uniref:Transcriptional regulator n=1 Tax=Microlunatus endophyticus TaxID=1716077 RepID=A0A917W8A9_9ACTN|nr:Lrp/AsnC family transcriptional regulator [Microlunatus endophyticus]GGL76275.1 transcriptional regulator [Microlunatus endophyticus]